MKILQVDTVGTERGACAAMGAPRSPKGGEERTGEKGRRRRRAACQRGTWGEGPRENGVACECPSHANGAVGVHQRGAGGAKQGRGGREEEGEGGGGRGGWASNRAAKKGGKRNCGIGVNLHKCHVGS